MVNTAGPPARLLPRAVPRLVAAYVTIAFGTLLLLAVLSAVSPDRAGREAWVHAVIVGALAAVLPLRLRAARHGSARARTAVVVIAAVLAVANVVEASVPGLFPGWMRIEMLATAAVMVALLASLARGAGGSPYGR